MPEEALSIVDKRTQATYEVPIHDGTIRAMDLRQIKTGPDDFGLMTYDPAFMNTASCRSAITFIDGDKGILRYRGYPIEQLAEKCTFLEVAYLILFGELPTEPQLKEWVSRRSPTTPCSTKPPRSSWRASATTRTPWGCWSARWRRSPPYIRKPAMCYDPEVRKLQIMRLIGKMPTIAAYTYRHSLGYPYVYPDNDLSYAENFMNMLWKMVEPKYTANPDSGARAGHPVHPARRPRAELQHQHDARGGQFASRSVPLHRRRRGRAFRPSARRRQRRSPQDAG